MATHSSSALPPPAYRFTTSSLPTQPRYSHEHNQGHSELYRHFQPVQYTRTHDSWAAYARPLASSSSSSSSSSRPPLHHPLPSQPQQPHHPHAQYVQHGRGQWRAVPIGEPASLANRVPGSSTMHLAYHQPQQHSLYRHRDDLEELGYHPRSRALRSSSSSASFPPPTPPQQHPPTLQRPLTSKPLQLVYQSPAVAIKAETGVGASTSGGGGSEAGGGGGEAGAPQGPIVSSTLWEDERTIVMQVLVDGHVVARRADNDWINSTKLLNMAGLTRGKRDMYLKNEPQRIVFRRGALHLKGVWLPLPAASRLARSYNLYDRLYPLFEPNIRKFLFSPVNRERTTQLVRAARAREVMPKPEDEKGISEAVRSEREERSKALDKLLDDLEEGLLMTLEALEAAEGVKEEDDGGTSVAAPVVAEHASETGTPSLARRSSLSDEDAEGEVDSPEPAQQHDSRQHSLARAFTSALGGVSPPSASSPSRPPPSRSSFSLSLQYLHQLQQASSVSSRRPSLDPNFTRDFRQPVSWYDNPTPPAEGPHLSSRDYFSAAEADAVRRFSIANSVASRNERELEALVEGEEAGEWGVGGVVARSRPPVVGGEDGAVLGRRRSEPLPGQHYADFSIAPSQEQQQHEPVHAGSSGRSRSLPPVFDQFPPYPPLPVEPLQSFHHPPHPAPPAATFPSIVAGIDALSSHPPPPAPEYATLARFGARLAVDSSAEEQAVYPPDGHYGWSAPRELTPMEQLEAILSGADSASTATGTGTPQVEPSSRFAEQQQQASVQQRHAAGYAFPPSPVSYSHARPSLVRTQTQRVLDELDAEEAAAALATSACFSFAETADGPAPLPLSRRNSAVFYFPSTSRRGSLALATTGTGDRSASLPLPPAPEEHPRLSEPAGRRDSLCDVFAVAAPRTDSGSGSGSPGVEKRPRRAMYGAEVDGEEGRENAGVADVEKGEEEREAKRRRCDGVEEGEKAEEEGMEEVEVGGAENGPPT
ncbi:hypothetical protein JCM8097_007725 [Rhodosporidiobolus ruineniae]